MMPPLMVFASSAMVRDAHDIASPLAVPVRGAPAAISWHSPTGAATMRTPLTDPSKRARPTTHSSLGSGMPQYTLGHIDRAEKIEELVAAADGLGLAGGMLRGVGVPNCLESGEKEVSRILGGWGIELAEDSTQEQRVY